MPQEKQKTDDHFYNYKIKKRQEDQNHICQQVTAKPLKKGSNPSKQVLKIINTKEGMLLQRKGSQLEEISQFSQSAKQSISKIQSRMGNIQEKLRNNNIDS
jgi:hypothetical protein